jgi:hypothetical protein
MPPLLDLAPAARGRAAAQPGREGLVGDEGLRQLGAEVARADAVDLDVMGARSTAMPALLTRGFPPGRPARQCFLTLQLMCVAYQVSGPTPTVLDGLLR